MASVRRTLRSASLVSVGTLIGQLLAFAGSLVLVRIFSPSEMGVFSTVVAISSFVAPLASGRLAMAIPLPTSHKSAMTLVKMATIGAAAIGLLIGCFLLLWGTFSQGNRFLESAWWWGLPSLVLSLAVYLCANQLAVRFEMYWGLALRGVLYPLVMTGGQILLGLAHFGSSGLILGMVLGHVVTALTLWLPIQGIARTRGIQGAPWLELLKLYKQFPLFLGPAGAINGLAMQLPQIGVTFIFGLAVGGQFGLMMKILAVPITLIGQSIGFVYAGQIAKARREGQVSVRGLFDRLSALLATCAVVLTVGVVFLAEPTFAWLLGGDWRMSGELAALFIISTAMQLVSSPLSQTLVISERTRTQLSIDTARALALIVTMAVIHVTNIEMNSGVLIIATVSALGYFLLWILNRKAALDIRP